jgi:flagellin-like protein
MDTQGGDRGVSPVLGSILVFAIVVLLLSVLQVYAVPAEDKSAELSHYQGIQGDLQTVRSALLDVGGAGATRTASVTVDLGLRYPTRMVLLSPPPASGRLSTERLDSGEITAETTNVSRVCGTREPTRTKTLTYEAGYARLDVAPIHLEQGLLYRRGADGAVLRESGQPLVDGNEIHLYALQGNVSADGAGATGLDLYGADVVGINTTVPGPVNLTVPTRLSAANWSAALAGESTVERVRDVPGRPAVEITLDDSQDYTLRCSVVGIGTQPTVSPEWTVDEQQAATQNPSLINPAGDGMVLLNASVKGTGNDEAERNTVKLWFENTGDTRQKVVEARLPFYSSDSQGSGSGAAVGSVLVREAGLNRSEGLETLPNPFTLAPGEKGSFYADVYCGPDATGTPYEVGIGDFFVLTTVFDDGRTRTYFVAVETDQKGKQPCN